MPPKAIQNLGQHLILENGICINQKKTHTWLWKTNWLYGLLKAAAPVEI